MFELKVDNGKGEVLNLSTTPNYTLFKIEGLNPPHASVNMSANVLSDGSNVNAVRVETRNIVLYLTVDRNVEANRINLYRFFPLKKTVTLYYKNDTREVKIEGVVEIIECDLFATKQIVQVSIICPKPYFKSVDYLVTNFSEITSLFEFPFSITSAGTQISEITTNVRKSIINTGDIDTGVIVRIFATGEVVNPALYNVFKRTHIQLNFTMQASDEIVINTNVNEKSVTLIRAGVESNILGYMSLDSEWFVLESGDNLFTFDADSGTNFLQISFYTSTLYGGV